VARRIKWTEQALADLTVVADYIALDSPHYAAAFVREVRDAVRSLANFAERGRIVPEFANRNVRELIVRDYRLIYSFNQREVYFLAFIHGARDLAQLWQREDRTTPGK